MNHDALTRFLAERVMGWKWYDYLKGFVPYEGCRLDEAVYRTALSRSCQGVWMEGDI